MNSTAVARGTRRPRGLRSRSGSRSFRLADAQRLLPARHLTGEGVPHPRHQVRLLRGW